MAVVALTNVVLQLLGGLLITSGSGCDAVQSLTIVVALSTASVFLALQPTRILLTSFLSAIAMILLALVTLLGVMCRHDVVQAPAVIAVGVVCSVFGVCQSVFTAGATAAEMYLMRQHGSSSERVLCTTEQGDDVRMLPTSSIIISPQHTHERHPLNTATMTFNFVVNDVARRVSRDAALSRLVQLICEKHAKVL